MSQRTIYQLTGYLSILTGIAALLCIFRIQYMYYALGLSIIGFVLSGTNIFIGVKNEYDKEGFSKGYLGMLLSSLPVLFLLFVIFKYKK